MKHYYSVSHSQIYSFLIPIYYNLDRSNINAFVDVKVMENFLNFLTNAIMAEPTVLML